ncbi:MAG: hypothetical protein V8R78_00015 [Evtepia gabavorous]
MMSFRWFQFGFLIFVLGIQSRLTLQNTGSVSADRHAAPEEESSKEQIIHLIHEEDQRRPTEPTMLTRATAISTATVQGIAAIRSRMDNNLAPPPAIDSFIPN